MNGRFSVKINSTPKDVRKIILAEQAEMKAKCDCSNFSQEKTLVMIVRKWARIKDYRVNGVPISRMAEELIL